MLESELLFSLWPIQILVQPIPCGVTFSKTLPKLKAQSSNVSCHWNVAKETFELWALSFETWFENVNISGTGCTISQTNSHTLHIRIYFCGFGTSARGWALVCVAQLHFGTTPKTNSHAIHIWSFLCGYETAVWANSNAFWYHTTKKISHPAFLASILLFPLVCMVVCMSVCVIVLMFVFVHVCTCSRHGTSLSFRRAVSLAWVLCQRKQDWGKFRYTHYEFSSLPSRTVTVLLVLRPLLRFHELIIPFQKNERRFGFPRTATVAPLVRWYTQIHSSVCGSVLGLDLYQWKKRGQGQGLRQCLGAWNYVGISDTHKRFKAC